MPFLQLHAEAVHARGDVGLAQRLGDRGLQPLDNAGRKPGRTQKSDLRRNVETRIAKLGAGRNLGNGVRSHGGADAERPDLTGLDQCLDLRNAGPAGLNRAGQYRRNHLRRCGKRRAAG